MTTRSAAFTTTHWVINRVHHDTTVVRTTTEPTAATGLTGAFESVVGVTYGTDGSLTCGEDTTRLTRRHLDDGVEPFARSKLSEDTRRANHLSALTWTKLDIVNDRTDRDVSQWEAVPYLRCSFCTRHHFLTYLQTVRSEDISLRTISVVQQSDTSRTIWVVLDALDRSRDTVLVSLEVDKTKLLLVTTTDVAHGHLTGVVTTTRLLLTYDKGLLWCAGSDVIERTNNLMSLPRGCGLEFTYCHC